MVRTFGSCHALDRSTHAGRVHKGEHAVQTAVRRANEEALGLVEVHHAGGRRLDTHLVLDGAAGHGVALTQGTVSIDVDLGDDEQGDAFGSFRRVRQAGQHDVDDVIHHVVFAGRNEDFGTGNGIGTIGVRLGLGTQDTQVGTTVRFGQTHSAGPLTTDQTGQKGVFLFLGAVLFQGLDGAMAQAGVHPPGPVGSAHHFAHHDAQRVGQALTTVFHVSG